jgi:cytochrome c biogenesis protein ResB
MKIIDLLTSRGFAIFLLLISIGILLFRKYSGLYSELFLFVPLLLFISILLCLIKRIIKEGKGSGLHFYGSILFHLGMLVIIFGGSLGYLTRFNAVFVLPQGETISMDSELSTVLLSSEFATPPVMNIRLNSYKSTYEEGIYVVDHKAFLTIGYMDGAGFKTIDDVISINSTLWCGPYQLMLELLYQSPQFILTDSKGDVVFNENVKISNRPSWEDSFEIKQAGLTIHTRFFPDIVKDGTTFTSRSPELNNPAIGIRVVQKKNPFTDAASVVLKLGEDVAFDGYNLQFKELVPFVTIKIMRDPSYWVFIVGWLMLVLGLVIRYIPNEELGTREADKYNT